MGHDSKKVKGPNKSKEPEPLRKLLTQIEPMTEERINRISECLSYFLYKRLGVVEVKTVENALIILGDKETIEKHNVGPLTFSDLLADARHYPATVFGYYNKDSGLLEYFSGASPRSSKLVRVRFTVDVEKITKTEMITGVHFDKGVENRYLSELKGLPIGNIGAVLNLNSYGS